MLAATKPRISRLSSFNYSLGHRINCVLWNHCYLICAQNADDNSYPLDRKEDPSLAFVVQKDCVTILNNECGFEEKNVRAVCDVGKSTKGKHTCGYIGKQHSSYMLFVQRVRHVMIHQIHDSVQFMILGSRFVSKLFCFFNHLTRGGVRWFVGGLSQTHNTLEQRPCFKRFFFLFIFHIFSGIFVLVRMRTVLHL